MARKVAPAAKKHKSTTGAVVKNKVTSPMVKFVDMRAASGERMAIARAKMAEKFKHMKASIQVSMVRFRHPVNPIHRVAAREAAQETKAAATERRKQAVAAAKNNSSRKRALIREKRARNLKTTMA
ncbi:hypothetical protein SELMODRAFT_442734 [Selaginella moellendorffii]|uniref:Uncharacterized protein n=1 Tax=Selaginella moellendorffii TaxID=88036 RepID=D8RVM2_SELML|nr:hypothetical protein SELMODRAFT_442734 [Selaginella moellendorffii]